MMRSAEAFLPVRKLIYSAKKMACTVKRRASPLKNLNHNARLLGELEKLGAGKRDYSRAAIVGVDTSPGRKHRRRFRAHFIIISP